MPPITERTAEAMLAGCDALFAETPTYVVIRTTANAHVLPTDFPDAIGYSGTDLDLQCAQYLMKSGRWTRRGLAQVFNAKHFTPGLFLGTVVHEGGHHLAWQISQQEQAGFGHHGPTWIRGTLHLWQRGSDWLARRGGPGLSLGDVLRLSGYSASAGWQYVNALSDELAHYAMFRETPICRILRSTPPPAFRDLVNSDADRNGWPRPYASNGSLVSTGPVPASAPATKPPAQSRRPNDTPPPVVQPEAAPGPPGPSFDDLTAGRRKRGLYPW